MATLQLPIDGSVFNYRVGTTIAGVQYLLDLRWNARDEAWYMDLLDDEGVLIRAGMKLVLGALIGGRDASGDFPAVDIMVSDLSNAGVDATFDDLGIRVAVYAFEDTA